MRQVSSQHPGENHPEKKVGENFRVSTCDQLSFGARRLQTGQQRFAQRTENRFENLAFVIRVVVNFPDHCADKGKIFLQQLVVADGMFGKICPKVAAEGWRPLMRLNCSCPEILADNGGDQTVLGLEMAEESHFVHSGFPGDLASGRTSDAVPGKNPRRTLE